MEDETIEDVKAAYALLHRDMAALRVKADVLCEVLKQINADIFIDGVIRQSLVKEAKAAIANYTGA